jgi:hypothetical protein
LWNPVPYQHGVQVQNTPQSTAGNQVYGKQFFHALKKGPVKPLL